jgi:hypothetical protein
MESAIKIYGKEVVYEVQMIVDISDVDGAYNHFSDLRMHTHAECVEYMYM